MQFASFCSLFLTDLLMLSRAKDGTARDIGLEISRATLDGSVLEVGELLIPGSRHGAGVD